MPSIEDAHHQQARIAAEMIRPEGANGIELDAAITNLGNTLLYGGLPIDEQVVGYGYLRSLYNGVDVQTQGVLEDVLQGPWVRMGLYHYSDPTTDTLPTFGEARRPEFYSVFSSRGISFFDQNEAVGILLLAQQFAEKSDEKMTQQGLEKRLLEALGPDGPRQRTARELEQLFVLTHDNVYVPLVQRERQRIGLTPEAYQALEPHLAILHAASFPQERLSQAEMQTADTVGKTLKSAFRAARGVFQRDLSDVSLQRHIVTLDGLAGERSEKGIIAPIIEQITPDGVAHSIQLISRYTTEDTATVEFARGINPISDRGIILDFFGNPLPVVPFLRVHSSGDSASAEVSPGNVFPDASTMDISATAVSIKWHDVSEGHDVPVTLTYATEVPGQMKVLGTKTIVGEHPFSLQVEQSRPQRERRGLTEYEDTFWETRPLTISFSKSQETIHVDHPKGAYEVSYEQTPDVITVQFTGQGWNKTITIPQVLDVVAIARDVERSIKNEVVVTTNPDDILRTQAQSAYQLSPLEEVVLANSTTPLSFAELQERVATAGNQPSFARRKAFSEQFAQLTPDQQLILRAYITSQTLYGRNASLMAEMLGHVYTQFPGTPPIADALLQLAVDLFRE